MRSFELKARNLDGATVGSAISYTLLCESVGSRIYEGNPQCSRSVGICFPCVVFQEIASIHNETLLHTVSFEFLNYWRSFYDYFSVSFCIKILKYRANYYTLSGCWLFERWNRYVNKSKCPDLNLWVIL